MYNCSWVCHCWTICSKCQVPGIFNLWIPLQAQTPLNNTKGLSENTCQLIVTVKEWLCDLQFIGCGSLIASPRPPSLMSRCKQLGRYRSLQAARKTFFSTKSSRPGYHFLFLPFLIFLLSNHLSKPSNDKYYWEKVWLTKQFFTTFFGLCTLHINENSCTFHSC